MHRPVRPHGCGNDLDSYPRDACIDHSKLLGCSVRQVNNASLYEGTPIIDPDNNMRASVYSRHTHHRAKRQMAMRGSELFGWIWDSSVE
jgi:hypothetical protein